ncbi:hypothetical protein JIN84_20415 [Luteolibacter yonseiensis]|uniref:DUF3618 domain-containing protein n=1 Tax=Luteolibacter yonseiensis TaxID=1144680 RepID=A0A934R410_9BACT|nr:hypothetical protein [Luteolibacter yonseiensis]MBK1817998.1 hypothetical protein [Luteolibacter yonseiensis]
MATQKTQAELRRRAIEDLASSREEIGVEVRRLKHELNPGVVMHKVVDRHKAAVVVTTLGIGAVASLLVFRRMRHRPDDRGNSRRVRESGDSPGFTSSMLRLAAGTLVPVVLKSLVVSPLVESLARPGSNPAGDPASFQG